MLSLGYIYLDFVSWRRKRQAVEMYRQLAEVSSRASFVLCRNKLCVVNRLSSIEKLCRPGKVPDYQWKLFTERNGFSLHEVIPRVSLPMQYWSLPNNSNSSNHSGCRHALLEVENVKCQVTRDEKVIELKNLVSTISRVSSSTILVSLDVNNEQNGQTDLKQDINVESPPTENFHGLIEYILNGNRIMDNDRIISVSSMMSVTLESTTNDKDEVQTMTSTTDKINLHSSKQNKNKEQESQNLHSFDSDPKKDLNVHVDNTLSATDIERFKPRRDQAVGKPPNVLIYCGKSDSRRLFEGLRKTFSQCLNPDHYTIYHLKHEDVTKAPWSENTALLIVASDKVYDGVDKAFIEYFLRGGSLISFTSALDSKFLDRIDGVSSKSPSASKPVMSSVAYDKFDCFTAICGRYSYDVQESSLIKEVSVTQLATDASTKRAVIVEISHEKSGSIGILSQVNLEKDPSEMAISTEVFTSLKSCNSVRFEVLRHLLSRLGLNCESSAQGSTLTPIYLLTNDVNIKSSFLDSVRPRLRNGGQLISSGATTLVFDVDESYPVTGEKIPVLHDTTKDIKFNHIKYVECLKTRVVGNTVLFADVITSTMPVFGGLMFSVPHSVGLIAIARRQTQGQGRRENQWLSPLGCAMFSLHIRLPLDSNLGGKVTFIQHMVALAAVLAVRQKPGYEMLDVKIKWPNDVYFGSKMKLGGVIVKSSILSDIIHVNIGCGVNVENSNPTICINDLIRQHNNMLENGGGAGNRLEEICVEEFIGRTVTQLEGLIDLFQSEGPEPVLDLYYKYWLHGGVEVKVGSDEGQSGRILGLDDYGYLQVLMSDLSIATLQPDNNGFDMMRNLIVQK